MELVESSGVDDTHNGWFRVPVKVNQVPQAAQDLQWVRRLKWDWLEAQSPPDPMGIYKITKQD